MNSDKKKISIYITAPVKELLDGLYVHFLQIGTKKSYGNIITEALFSYMIKESSKLPPLYLERYRKIMKELGKNCS